MLDINQTLGNAHHRDYDPEGHLYALDHWSPQVANRLAAREGLELDDEAQWEIIYYLRERYRTRGNRDSARIVLRELEQRFSNGKGREHLYELFPGGPVGQGSRLAGLPVPAYACDPSFGSAM